MGLLMTKYEFNSDSCYVSFFDVLGYKQLVSNNSHELLKKVHQFSIPTSIASSQPKQRIINENGKAFLLGDYNEIDVHSVIVSDSIVVWTPDDSIKSFYDIIFKSMDILVEGLLRYLPVRGAITIGPLSCFSTASDSKPAQVSIFGQPIVEAYELQDKIDLIGCIVDRKAIDAFRVHSFAEKPTLSIDDLINKKVLVEYEIPHKSGKVTKLSSVNWTLNYTWNKIRTAREQRQSIRQFITEVFSHYDKDANTWEVRNKLKNTLEYINNISDMDLDYSYWPYSQGIIDSPIDKDK
jgi:hypothetical protein